MKRISIFLTILVLTLSLLTGCGCTPGGGTNPSVPGTATTPTAPVTQPATEPPTQVPTQAPTMPQESMGENGSTGESGMAGEGGMAGEENGMDDTNGGMTGTTGNSARNRGMK